MTENADEKILARAQEIKAKRGGSLTDAMLLAEKELAPRPTVPASFAVTIPVRPRVARWILAEFEPTPEHSLEQRLGAFLAVLLSRVRVQAMRQAGDGPEIPKGGPAVSMTRAQFQRRPLE